MVVCKCVSVYECVLRHYVVLSRAHIENNQDYLFWGFWNYSDTTHFTTKF